MEVTEDRVWWWVLLSDLDSVVTGSREWLTEILWNTKVLEKQQSQA